MTPTLVADFGGALGRSDNVGEHHRRKYPIWFESMMRTSDEFLDLIDQKIEYILIERLEQMVFAGKFDISGTRDVLSKIPSGRDRNRPVADAVKNQCRCTDRGQNVADIDLIVGAQEGQDRSWARGRAFKFPEPSQEHLILCPTRRIERHQNTLAPVSLHLAQEPRPLLFGQGPWFRAHRSKAAAQHQRHSPFRISGSEQQRHRAAFRPAEDSSAPRSRRIHNRSHVANALLKSLLSHPIRQPLSSFVEDDYASERGEPLQHVLVDGKVPEQLNVRKRSRDQNDIVPAVAEGAVCDVNVAALRVFYRSVHTTPPSLAGRSSTSSLALPLCDQATLTQLIPLYTIAALTLAVNFLCFDLPGGSRIASIDPLYALNCLSSALASFRSALSKPSV